MNEQEKNLSIIVRQEETIEIRRFDQSHSIWQTIGMAFGHEPLRSSNANVNSIVLQDEFTTFCVKSTELICSHPSRFYLYESNDPKRELIGFRNEEMDEEKMYEILAMLLSGKYDVADIGIEARYAFGLTGGDWLDNKKLLNQVHRLMILQFAPGSEDPQLSDHMIYAYKCKMRPGSGLLVVGWIYANGRINVFADGKKRIEEVEYDFLRKLSRRKMADKAYSAIDGNGYMLYRLHRINTAV